MDSSENVKPTVGFSFKFTKSVQPSKVNQAKLSIEDALNELKQEFVLSVEDKQIKSSEPEIVKEELVIPLIKENNWRHPKQLNKDLNNEKTIKDPKSLDELAANEIIAETRDHIEAREKSFRNDSLAIPLILQNKCPEGFETDDKLDVSLRPDPSTMDDYERIPVDQFGLAMLRGMGWKPGGAIGLKNKQCVEVIEVVVRPKGLGLGADKRNLEKLKTTGENGEELILRKESYVLIHEGHSKGLYGQVESLDDETGRVYVRLALDGKVIHLPELFLQVVSKKEFAKDGKVINKTKFDKVKNEIEEKHRIEIGENDSSNNNKSSRSRHSKKKKRRGRSNSPREDDEDGDSSSRRRRTKSRSRSPNNNSTSKTNSKHKKESRRNKESSEKTLKDNHKKSWLIAQIRVRFIDEKYKNGKYFNKKVVIEDILTPTICICRTDNGEVLDDIHPKMIETVIPRNEPGFVMVVRGPLKGLVGKILVRDKSSCTATVQLFPDNNVSKLSYDDVSEYVGDVSQYD